MVNNISALTDWGRGERWPCLNYMGTNNGSDHVRRLDKKAVPLTTALLVSVLEPTDEDTQQVYDP